MRNEFTEDWRYYTLKGYLESEPNPNPDIVFHIVMDVLFDSRKVRGLTLDTNSNGEPTYNVGGFKGIFSRPTSGFINELKNAAPKDILEIISGWYRKQILK